MAAASPPSVASADTSTADVPLLAPPSSQEEVDIELGDDTKGSSSVGKTSCCCNFLERDEETKRWKPSDRAVAVFHFVFSMGGLKAVFVPSRYLPMALWVPFIMVINHHASVVGCCLVLLGSSHTYMSRTQPAPSASEEPVPQEWTRTRHVVAGLRVADLRRLPAHALTEGLGRRDLHAMDAYQPADQTTGHPQSVDETGRCLCAA